MLQSCGGTGLALQVLSTISISRLLVQPRGLWLIHAHEIQWQEELFCEIAQWIGVLGMLALCLQGHLEALSSREPEVLLTRS